MRYYVKCRINPAEKQKVSDSINNGSMGRGKVFYEGMQTALREATIDDDYVIHFIEICYCLEGGLYPMAMEIPELNKHFSKVVEVKDARLRSECTMECEACDCTRSIKLPGKPLMEELGIDKKTGSERNYSVDIGRMKLNRKKQREGIQKLRNVTSIASSNKNSIRPVFAGAAISGLFVIYYDCKDKDYFRIKNIPDTIVARRMLKSIEMDVAYDVDSIKANALASLAKSDKRSNIT
jgi:hypothetical protein